MWMRIDRPCGKCARSLNEFLDGTLPLRRRRGVEAHLRVCAACRRELETLRRTVGLLAGLPRPELSDQFEEALRARLAEINGERRERGFGRRASGYLRAPWPSPLRRLAPAGVLAAAAAGLVAWNLQPAGTVLRPQHQPPAYVRALVHEHQMLNAGADINATVVGHNLGGDLLGDSEEE